MDSPARSFAFYKPAAGVTESSSTLGGRGDRRRRHGQVILNQLRLDETIVRPQDLLEVRQFDLVFANLRRLFRLRHESNVLKLSRGRQSGGGLGLVDVEAFFVALVEIRQTHPCRRGGLPTSNHPTWEKPP